MATSPTPLSALRLNDPELLRRVSALRQTDNWTGWYYLAREYVVFGTIVGGTIALYHLMEAGSLSWLWAVPLTLLTVLLAGAGQHRLASLTHEASHYMLFRNRLLNELVSEWFCMYPLLSSTHNYRVQHLGHHQFPNDPERDPDVAQLTLSGHRFRFPMSRGRFLWQCVLKQFLWPPNSIRYILVRAAFKVDQGGGSPYRLLRRPSKLLVGFSALYMAGLVVAAAWLVAVGDPGLLGLVPALMLAGALAFYGLLPEGHFTRYPIKSDLPERLQACMRVTYHTLVIVALAWLTFLTGHPWWLYYLVLWVVPLGTSFSFFMILRQLVQHGNASRERLTNTRIFHVNWLISAAVFPIGNDYHLPHHLFPMVPHYNLRALHALLSEAPEYREQATLVEGYFLHRESPPRHPTVLELMTRSR